jgi:hypothetical protein
LKTVGERLTVQPHICGYICICCGFCSSNNVDAIDYYSQEEARLKAEVSSFKFLHFFSYLIIFNNIIDYGIILIIIE